MPNENDSAVARASARPICIAIGCDAERGAHAGLCDRHLRMLKPADRTRFALAWNSLFGIPPKGGFFDLWNEIRSTLYGLQMARPTALERRTNKR